jgi:hypothetical protein
VYTLLLAGAFAQAVYKWTFAGMTTMKTYTFDDPAVGQITYRDNKRYLWLSAVFFPLIPFIGIFGSRRCSSH